MNPHKDLLSPLRIGDDSRPDRGLNPMATLRDDRAGTVDPNEKQARESPVWRWATGHALMEVSPGRNFPCGEYFSHIALVDQ